MNYVHSKHLINIYFISDLTSDNVMSQKIRNFGENLTS